MYCPGQTHECWWRWGYLLASDSPRHVRGSPHVSLQLFERSALSVRCHLPQHALHHLPDGLLLVRVHRLVHRMNVTRFILPQVFFSLKHTHRVQSEQVHYTVYWYLSHTFRHGLFTCISSLYSMVSPCYSYKHHCMTLFYQHWLNSFTFVNISSEGLKGLEGCCCCFFLNVNN